MNTKRTLAFVIFLCVTAALASAQSTSHIGAWSINATSEGHRSMVLLQTPALARSEDAAGSLNGTTLNVICKQGKVFAIALHTTLGIDKNAVSDIEEVPTTRVVALSEGHIDTSERWAVSEKGHTFSPYSELSQGRLNRYWLDRLKGAHTIVIQLNGSEATFDTDQLSSALSSAGCSN